jgi:uncharacterized protein YbjQ (UPF0145 family)
MSDIILTSGSDIEGYEIKDYLGLVSGQTALTAKFFQEFSGSSEMDAKESKALTKKLSQVHQTAVSMLEEEARKRGANAVIGITLRYNELTSSITNNNTIGIIATGTAVEIREKENRKYEGVHQNLYVTNYYTKMLIRPVEVRIKADKHMTRISPIFMNYKNEEILAIRADVELTTYYDEKVVLRDMDFTFEKNNVSQLEADWIECDIKEREVKLIKDAKVIVRKYVTARKVVTCEELPISTELNYRRLDSLKKKRGIDAVVKYQSNGMIWTCVCGCINKISDAECDVCGRKEAEIKNDLKFNYDSMLEELATKDNVTEMKDLVIKKYIKDIDPDSRMELLQTLESALQYEKTRGDMKEVVIEKIQNIFES